MDQKELVITLRKQGKTYSEISHETGILKGSISRLLRGVIFDADSAERIIQKQFENRSRGVMKLKLAKEMKMKFSARASLISAKKKFEKNKSKPLFLAGLLLYWSHGSFINNYFQFSSGDDLKVRTMIDWLLRYSTLTHGKLNFRVYAPEHKENEAIKYWSKFAGNEKKIKFTAYRASKSKKNVENKGFLQILCFKVSVQNEIKFLIKMLINCLENKK